MSQNESQSKPLDPALLKEIEDAKKTWEESVLNPLLERYGVRREEFEGRAGCVFALDRPVEHREIISWVIQFGPPVEGESTDRFIRVVRGI